MCNLLPPCRRRQWHPTPVLLPGKSQGWRSLVGCSPWGRTESDTTERLHFHFSLSCIGEGNGNPLQCSCLENPRTAEPGGLPSMGSHRVGHNWSDLAVAASHPVWRPGEQPKHYHHHLWHRHLQNRSHQLATLLILPSASLSPCLLCENRGFAGVK